MNKTTGPRKTFSNRIFPRLLRRDDQAPERYHQWFYNNKIWSRTKWMGIDTWKSPSDMWNYQEILSELQPSLIVEFGTNRGGSTLFFAMVMRQIGRPFRVLSVDVDQSIVSDAVRRDPAIELLQCSSSDPATAVAVGKLKLSSPGGIFAILDSDHAREHVLEEMKLLRPLLSAGDYLIVEDSNINGHPVAPLWGPGPHEAIDDYFRMFPDDYMHDLERERKFGVYLRTRRISCPQILTCTRRPECAPVYSVAGHSITKR